MRFLDTDIMIDLLRGHPPAVAWLSSLPGNEEAPALPGYVVMELLSWQGIHTKKTLHRLYDILAEFEIYWPSSDSCNNAMVTLYERCLDKTLSAFDALVAECAQEHQAVLCTTQPARYTGFEDLILEQPYPTTNG